jgi:hypothetical protein
MTPPNDPAPPRGGRWLQALLWLWVAGMTGAYLAQFRTLFAAVLDQYL